MPQTTTSCPRCRQPVTANIEQLFDMNTNPKAKQLLLSGAYNLIRCPSCGYEGVLSTPIVYHDPEKELLLTFFPSELGLPINDQERLIGPMITQVTNKLPAEKRKAYLLRPQTMLTMDSLIERILQADGITREMLQAQQQRLNLIQRLATATPEVQDEIIKQEEALIDQDLFSILSRIIELSLAQGDQQGARMLTSLQQNLLTKTQYGQQLQSQAKEAELAVKSLQEASKSGGLTREKLLDLVIDAPTEIRLTTLVNLARSGMDYNFFQLLTNRIDNAGSEQKQKLIDLREKLLKMTEEIDKAVQAQMDATRELLHEVMTAPDPEKAITDNLDRINDLFLDMVHAEQDAATRTGDQQKLGKINKIIEILQKLSPPRPELQFLQELLSVETPEERQKVLESHADLITPEFLQMLSGMVAQGQSQDQPEEVVNQVQAIYRAALRFSMQSKLNQSK